MEDKNSPLQDRVHKEHPIRHCFGCGADNHGGLRIKSYDLGEEAVCVWHAEDHHQAYPGYLNGGIASTLIDCHGAWAAFAQECREKGLDPEAEPALVPTGWTKVLHVEFLKPTPLKAELTLRAKVIKKGRTSRTVACSLYANDEECVRGEVVMVMTSPQ